MVRKVFSPIANRAAQRLSFLYMRSLFLLPLMLSAVPLAAQDIGHIAVFITPRTRSVPTVMAEPPLSQSLRFLPSPNTDSRVAAVYGSVRDAEGMPLRNVAVTIRNAADSSIVALTRSHGNGRFLTETLVPGTTYVVQADAPGYSSAVSTTFLASNDSVRVAHIILRPADQPTSSVLASRNIGDGRKNATTVSPADFRATVTHP
jgi:hypothetical protein